MKHTPRISNQLQALLPEPEPQELAETLVAFANADGGTLYVGLNEDGTPSGGLYPEDFEAAVQQAVRMCHPPVEVRWEQEERDGAFVFVGSVPRSHDLHTLEGGVVLIRTGAENRPLQGTRLQQLAATRLAGEYEAEIVDDASRDDFDEKTLERFLERWQVRSGRPLTQPLDEILQEHGWLHPTGHPTVAGMLLFGKRPQAWIPRSGLTFVRFDGTHLRKLNGEPGYGRRLDVSGTLDHLISHTWDMLQEELRVGAVVRGLERREQWLYPPGAIREALVNAVAHRDYRIHGRGIEVRLFADRLEIYSPGALPGFITVDNIVDEHYSRNPRIVNGLYQWGYIEELGLGVDLMIEEMVNAGHPPPDFQSTEHSFTVIFRQKHRRRIARAYSGETMNERQIKALAYLQEHGRITNREYQRLCPDVSAETLRLDLVDMVKRGLLLKVGAKRGTHYILK